MLFSLLLGMVCTSEECFPHVAGMHSFVVLFTVYLCVVSSVTKQLARSVHYRHSILPEISKVNLIKELLRVKYKMLSVSLLYCTDIDFMVEWLCTNVGRHNMFLSVGFVSDTK